MLCLSLYEYVVTAGTNNCGKTAAVILVGFVVSIVEGSATIVASLPVLFITELNGDAGVITSQNGSDYVSASGTNLRLSSGSGATGNVRCGGLKLVTVIIETSMPVSLVIILVLTGEVMYLNGYNFGTAYGTVNCSSAIAVVFSRSVRSLSGGGNGISNATGNCGSAITVILVRSMSYRSNVGATLVVTGGITN